MKLKLKLKIDIHFKMKHENSYRFGTEPLKRELNKTPCSRLLILCILPGISSLVLLNRLLL